MYDYRWPNSVTHHEPLELKWIYRQNLGDQSTSKNLIASHRPPHWPWESNHQRREGFCEGKKKSMDAMITPVTASETYLQAGRSKYKTEMQKPADADVSLRLFSPRFKKHRPAREKFWISGKKKDGKQYEKESDGALCKTETQQHKSKELDILSWSGICSINIAQDMKTYTSPHFMRPIFLYSSTIRALALASALARSFFLKHNLHKKAISHKWSWNSAFGTPHRMQNYRGFSPP